MYNVLQLRQHEPWNNILPEFIVDVYSWLGWDFWGFVIGIVSLITSAIAAFAAVFASRAAKEAVQIVGRFDTLSQVEVILSKFREIEQAVDGGQFDKLYGLLTEVNRCCSSLTASKIIDDDTKEFDALKNLQEVSRKEANRIASELDDSAILDKAKVRGLVTYHAEHIYAVRTVLKESFGEDR